MTPDSPLVDRTLVAESYDRQGAPILAVVIHFAEGGGTDTWLTRIDGNSSHYVVKYSGELVQLVPESMAAGSLNPRLTRTTDDDPYTFDGTTVRYGRSTLDAVLGEYAAIKSNRAVIAIEVEGFASAGPNGPQAATLKALIADIRARRHIRGLLGHRDQQAYKACPGKRVPWGSLGGHGLFAPAEDDMRPFPIADDPQVAAIRVGAQLYLLDATPAYRADGSLLKVSNAPAADSPYRYRTGGVDWRVVEVTTGGVPHLWLARESDCTLDPPKPAVQPAVTYSLTIAGEVVAQGSTEA